MRKMIPMFLQLACMLLAIQGVQAASLPAFNLADTPETDLEAGAWSAAQADGAVKYRAALKGKSAQFNVKAWWAPEALRPPEGVIFVLEINYKDTVTSPAVFTSFGGVGEGFGQRELHRFGGAGDRAWKTAHVPVSWDQLARIVNKIDPAKNKPDWTAFGVKADADLPIATLTVRLAAPGDEERFNAETRAWVAAVQAHKRADLPPVATERKFLVGQQLPPLVAFSWRPLVLLLPDAQPKDEQVGAPIKIRMAQNQFESGSFGVYANGTTLTNVDYNLSELKTAAGQVLKAAVIRRTAEVALLPGKAGPHAVPVRLWPAYKTAVPAGQSQWFYFNVQSRRGETRPGMYKGVVNVTSDQGNTELPVEVEVLPIDLLTMTEAGLSMGGCTTGLVPIHDIDFQVAYNQNATNLWFSSCAPQMALKAGKLELDFTYMDDWLCAAQKRGMVNFVYFLGGDPYKFPYTLHAARELYGLLHPGPKTRSQFGEKQSASAEQMLPELRPLFKDLVKQLYAHSIQAGWPEMLVTPFDEPAKWVQTKNQSQEPGSKGAGPWIKSYFKDVCALIHEAEPKLRIYASIHHNRQQQEGMAFVNDVDVFCTNAIQEDLQLGDKVRAAKRTFWQYGGGDSPDKAAFQFGYYFAAFDSRGSLCWAYNWGRGFDLSEGENWMYAWQTPFSTIPSPFFEGLREGWDARRLIETYRRKFASNPEALKVLTELLDSVKNSRAAGGRDTVNDFWAAADDVGKLDAWRNRLLDQLLKAK